MPRDDAQPKECVAQANQFSRNKPPGNKMGRIEPSSQCITSCKRSAITLGSGLIIACIVSVALPLALLGRSLVAGGVALAAWLLTTRLISRGAEAVFRRLQSESLVTIHWLLITFGLTSGLLASFVWFYTRGESSPPIRVFVLTVYLAGCASLLTWLSTLNAQNQIVVGSVLGIGLLVSLWLLQHNSLQLIALFHRHPLYEYDPRYLKNWETFVFRPYSYLFIQMLALLSLFNWTRLAWRFYDRRKLSAQRGQTVADR